MAEQGPRGGNTEDQGDAAGGRGGGNEGQGAAASTGGGGSIIQYEVKLDMDDQLTQERLYQLYPTFFVCSYLKQEPYLVLNLFISMYGMYIFKKRDRYPRHLRYRR
jgi:hypothetical protein